MSNPILNPNVRWAQDKSVLFLTVDLLDVQNPEIQITDHTLRFKAIGHGAHGKSLYQFEMLFYKKIYPKQCLETVTPRQVQFHLQKGKTEDPWPRLLSSDQKPAWLKIDFDKWDIDDTTDDEEANFHKQINQITIENRTKSEVEKAKDDMGAFARLAYLTVYNGAQAIAFTVIVFRLIMALVRNGKDGMYTSLEDVGDLIITCQLAAFIEIINPLLGVVKTGIVAPLMQVLGRNFVLFLIVLPEKTLHTNPATFWLFLVWSLIEVIRYPFYVLSLFNITSKPITWLRYTLWLPCYPAGILLESYLIFSAISLVAESKRLCTSLPSPLNFSFYFPYFLVVYLIIMPAAALYVLKHMWIQRTRRLAFKKTKRN